MIVRTFTSAWNLRTKIYAFDDVKVPVKGGITVFQLVAGVVAAIVWIPLMLLTGVTGYLNTGFAAALLLGPPILVTMKADTPIANEKTVEEWLSSWTRRRMEPKRLADLAPARQDHTIRLTASRWVPKDDSEYGRQPREVGRST